MKSLLQLPVMNNKAARILHITDTHLFAAKNETLLNVNTYDSYQAVLKAIEQQSADYDLIVRTGDLAQDCSFDAYLNFANGIKQLPAVCVWLPGNHDVQPKMHAVLDAAGLPSSKQVLLGDSWYLILLDSQLLPSAHGKLNEDQLNWLDRCLMTHNDRHALILIHHHPVLSGCAWLDQHQLHNADQLALIIARYPLANTLLCGHIHQELDVDWHGCRVLATPSTGIQFKPDRSHFKLDSMAPAWRYLDLLTDGTVRTQVHRLDFDAFFPDLNAGGY